jgi:general secretion pathway protein D
MTRTESPVEPRVKSEMLSRTPEARARSGRMVRASLVAVAVIAISACAAGREFRNGEKAALAGNWDEAVRYYRKALQSSPDNPKAHIALERAMNNAARIHLEQARSYEQRDELDLALTEYRKVVEFDGANRSAAARVQELEKTIRDRIEASRPRPKIDTMKDQARRSRAEPQLNPASRDPIEWEFPDTPLKSVFSFISASTGINIMFDSTYQDKNYAIKLKDVTLEQALYQITVANGLFYKVLNERTIIIVPDSQTKRAAYEEQAIQTFFVSHADVTELATLVTNVLRVQVPVQPILAANKVANSITARASLPVLDIIERIIEANDKPRAEIVIDVEILEINRNRAKQYGLELSSYSLNLQFSPESAPGGGGAAAGGSVGGGTAGAAAPAAGTFNLNTISRGISTADFYASVPSAIMHFLESDSETKVIAKPQLRGTEGEKLTLNLGEDIPVPSTTFSPMAAGGTAFQPMTSFQYRPVGVIVEIEPRVTYEGDIRMKLSVESSARSGDVNIGGQNLPSFGSRKVTTVLRLRDGESNLLAGLLREDDRRSLSGFPGAIHTPILKQLFSSNNKQIQQTDIVMLLTPRIVRTHELTQKDLNPFYIGPQSSLGLVGPPPLISSPGETTAQAPSAAPPTLAGVQTRPGVQAAPTVPTSPAGTSPVPGTIAATPPPAAAAQPPQAPPAGLPTQPQVEVLPPPQAPPATGGQTIPPSGGMTFPMPSRPPAATPAQPAGAAAKPWAQPVTPPTAPPAAAAAGQMVQPATGGVAGVGRRGGHGVDDRGRAVQRANRHREHVPAQHPRDLGRVQPGGRESARRAGGELHAPGRRHGDLQPAG